MMEANEDNNEDNNDDGPWGRFNEEPCQWI